MTRNTVAFSSRRVMGMRSCDSRCLFSGSKGEVCCIEPLRTPPDFRDHPITCYSLLAMASLTKVRTPSDSIAQKETDPQQARSQEKNAAVNDCRDASCIR